MLAGRVDGGRASFSTISEAVGMYNAGKMSEEKLRELTTPTRGLLISSSVKPKA